MMASVLNPRRQRIRQIALCQRQGFLHFVARSARGGGRGGRRRRSKVGDRVANSYVCFVADGRDHGNGTRCYSTRNSFVVECPEVFLSATASSDDHDVGFPPAGQASERSRNFARRSVTLDLNRTQNEARSKIALAHYHDNVAERSSIRAGDYGHHSRKTWNGPLARLVEQPFATKFRQRQLHRFPPQAISFGVDSRDLELKIRAGGIDSHVSEHHHLHSIVGRRRHPMLVAGPDDAANLRESIAEAEIPVPVPVALEVDDLAANPDGAQV